MDGSRAVDHRTTNRPNSAERPTRKPEDRKNDSRFRKQQKWTKIQNLLLPKISQPGQKKPKGIVSHNYQL